MKRITLILLAAALVFAIGVPVSLGAPEGFGMLTQDSSGTEVFRIQMRLRDLGYLNYRPTGMYKSMTQAAVTTFQQTNELDSDGRLGSQTYDKLFSVDAKRKPLGAGVVPPSGPALQGNKPSPGETADWATISAAIPVDATFTVTDYNTGKSFSVKRTGGTGHADVETVDKAATDTFLLCYGGAFTWEKRAVLVTAGDKTYAASLFGHPDGADTIADNEMQGHTCLYFTGSTSDVLGFVDKEHARNVLVAAGQL
jgi:peptidoglycan hydrolase-like protein with peptidoglycan-binding domain